MSSEEDNHSSDEEAPKEAEVLFDELDRAEAGVNLLSGLAGANAGCNAAPRTSRQRAPATMITRPDAGEGDLRRPRRARETAKQSRKALLDAYKRVCGAHIACLSFRA